MSAPTLWEGRTVTALQARRMGISSEMSDFALEVRRYIRENGGTQDSVLIDSRLNRHPGCLTIRWHGEPSPIEVATQFGVLTNVDGEMIPLLPGWLSLRRDDEFDIRWQLTYGHPHEHRTSPETEQARLESLDGDGTGN